MGQPLPPLGFAALAALSFVSVASVSGCSKKATEPELVSGHVAITAGEDGFSPSAIAVKKGSPLTLDFKRTSEKTCATEVVFPELKIEKPLPLGQVVSIDVPTDADRTITFQCGMAMYKSKVVIR
ncbi:MAG: cupredoxin domain-containing protein [Polyangiaceae bacterium]